MGNTIIKVNCLDQRLILSSMPLIASGGMNEDVAEFSFCPLWDGFAKTAIFYRNEVEIYYAIIDNENKCVIPWEVLQSDGKLFFGVYGVKGDVRRTSEILVYKIKLGAFGEKLKPSEPTPDIYAQYVNRIIDVENRVTPIEEFTIKPTPFELTGNPIQMQNFEGMPLKVVTAFEPKQSGSGDPSPDNVRPISGWDKAEARHCGKNLYDPAAVEINKGLDTNGKVVTRPNFCVSPYIPINGVVTCTFDTTLDVSTIVLYDANKEIVSHKVGYTSPQMLSDASAKYMRITTVTAKKDAVQVELSATATDFEVYSGQTLTADLPETVYGGKMDWNMGVLTEDYMLLTLNGSEDGYAEYGAIGGYTLLVPSMKPSSAAKGWASYFPVGWDFASYQMIIGNSDSSYLFFCHVNETLGISTLAEFKAYLAAHPLQVVVPMKTPVEHQLTPNDIAALDGINTIYGDGEITVSGRKDILWLTSGLIERIKTLEAAVVSLGGNV